jgi:hypothetical protein
MEEPSHFKKWGALYLLGALFIGSLAAQFITQLIAVGQEAQQHGQEFAMADFWPQFLSSVFENWQSEWLQLLVQGAVLLGMKHVLFKADAMDTEQMQMDLAEIKDHLGIPPRNETTRQELEQARRTRAAATTSG